MKKYLFLLLLTLSACTYSLNVAQSDGSGDADIKEDAKPEFDLKLEGNIPL